MDNTLRSLVDLRERTLMKNRIAFGNRLSAIEQGRDEASDDEKLLLERWNTRFTQLEKDVDEDILSLTYDLPIIDQMIAVKGIGRMLAARVVSMIDIEKADTVSALWKYAGYGVVDGHRDRPTKGEKLKYNKRLKVACYLLGESFLRCSSPYRSVYDSAKAYYEANRPEWPKIQRHYAAMRKMVKVFLSHLWKRWRTLEGLPVRNLYVEEYMGHTHILEPEEFGWPA